MAYLGRHVPEIGIQTRPETILATPNRPYKRARFVERQRCDAPAEVIPYSVLLEELLNVRKIKCGNLPAIVLDILADRANGLGPRKITYDRYDKVFAFEGFQNGKIFFVRQIASGDSLSIRGRH